MIDLRHGLTKDIAAATANASPGVAASVWTLNGVVALLTVVLVALQIAYLIWKWRRHIAKDAADKAVIAHLLEGRVARVGEKAPSA